MMFGRRAVRCVGGSLDGEPVDAKTWLLYFALEDGTWEEYRREGRFYVYAGVTRFRNAGMGASTTVKRVPETVLVPV